MVVSERLLVILCSSSHFLFKDFPSSDFLKESCIAHEHEQQAQHILKTKSGIQRCSVSPVLTVCEDLSFDPQLSGKRWNTVVSAVLQSQHSRVKVRRSGAAGILA